MDMIGGAEILRRRIEQRRKPMTEESNVEAVEVIRGEDEQWYWHGKAGNGEIVAQSEAYTRREDAIVAAEATFPSVQISASTTYNSDDDEAQVAEEMDSEALDHLGDENATT